ncbi:hypothetical protein [Flagellimonas lutaonensis]|uniref:Putative cell wall biosynthesis related protein n=1 Tax=Flagellimonas lutaonensis TaxID=516051 RepID=A0A0D5YQU0_9FLAO|nr:hypothetical protein [Allomuricauda lutaonensis]AKA34650.1 Putative cell wall biosynthesis related protein [Allomuricauda lutaonensis]
MRHCLAFFVFFLFSFMLLGQDSVLTVVAQPGDGIFSILRKQGIHPKKYFGAFLELNEGHIKNGSELKQGWPYKIPMAPDSFKNMGRAVSLPDGTETPLFDVELAKLDLKSEELKNAVYYLVVEDKVQNDFITTMATNLASRLLVNGAKVYVIKNESVSDDTANAFSRAQQYVDVVNKRYLKNQGKYQRLLILRANGSLESKSLDVSFYHYDGSDEGERLAENLKAIFGRYSKKVGKVSDAPGVFVDNQSLFLARNMLPPITVLSLSDAVTTPARHLVRKDQRALTRWIANGMLQDYADIEIEDR